MDNPGRPTIPAGSDSRSPSRTPLLPQYFARRAAPSARTRSILASAPRLGPLVPVGLHLRHLHLQARLLRRRRLDRSRVPPQHPAAHEPPQQHRRRTHGHQPARPRHYAQPGRVRLPGRRRYAVQPGRGHSTFYGVTPLCCNYCGYGGGGPTLGSFSQAILASTNETKFSSSVILAVSRLRCSAKKAITTSSSAPSNVRLLINTLISLSVNPRTWPTRIMRALSTSRAEKSW